MADAAVTPEQYRAYYWSADVEQWRFALLLFVPPTVVFAWFDLRLYGVSDAFFGFTVVRVTFTIYSLWLAFSLRRLQDRRLVERLLFLWTLWGVAVLAFNALGRPPDFFGHYVLEVFALMLFYSAMPMPLTMQGIVGLIYLAMAMPILFFYKKPPTAIYTINTAMVMCLTVFSGYLIARRIRGLRIDALGARLLLEEQVRTDALTGIANRRAFLDIATRELSSGDRVASPAAALMLDIDHFKHVNDRFGHEAGDLLLTEFARRVLLGLRSYDCFARLGGEEFAVLMPGADQVQARALAERLRAAVAGQPFMVRGEAISVTVSIGVAEVAPGETTVDGVLRRADRALYDAKEGGRNRVEVVA